LRIAEGLGMKSVPERLSYYSPEKSLYKLLPDLKGIIEATSIRFLILDSLGAACVDPDNVGDIVELFTKLKNLGIATLILDHQSKLQYQDNYNTKTPYGSVYKYNLSRSVFQLSCVAREENRISLQLRHKKANFSGFTKELTFDINFEGDKVQFCESQALSPDERDLRLIPEAMMELEEKGEKVNQKNVVSNLKLVLGRDRILTLLPKGEPEYWDKRAGDKKEILYKPKTLKNGYIYTPGFRVLEYNGDAEMPDYIEGK
jgi:hypothetical protein